MVFKTVSGMLGNKEDIMTYIIIGDIKYPCESLMFYKGDAAWEMRDSAEMKFEKSYAEVNAMFNDGTKWSFITDPDGDEVDCSEYSIKGNILVFSDGKCSVKMGKQTAMEIELADAKEALRLLGVNE